MEKQVIEELQQRIGQLEHLAWGLFRTLETYVTFNDRLIGGEDSDAGCFGQKTSSSNNEMETHRE